MYDVVIVGAGPAGANLARLIGSKYRVLLIDKRDLADSHPGNHAGKCCGGLLAPDAQKMIAKLGLGLPKDILVSPQLFAVRTIDLTNQIERLYQRFYFNMDREKFDRWLVSIIPADVEKRFCACFAGFTETAGGYEIRYRQGGHEFSVRTRIIVGADGALSRVRRLINRDADVPERYISIQEWFECPHPMPYFTAIFDEAVSDFYSWAIPKDGYLLLGTALRPKDDTWGRHEALKKKLTEFGFCFDKRLRTEGAFINRPRKISQFLTGRNAVALIGEAAGAISPSSAEGISYALKTSLYLAESLEDGLDGFLDRYRRKSRDIRLNLLFKNLKSPAMYNPVLRSLVMNSGLKYIK